MKAVLIGASLALALAAGTASAADNNASIKIGTLTCKATGITNVIVFSKTNFDCEYDGVNGEVTENYTGTISKIGVDLSIKNDVTLIWAVVAPSDTTYQPNALSGTYVGASADASLGLGAGAHVLVGGGSQSFTLQPVSVEGIEGVGASLGIESFDLKS